MGTANRPDNELFRQALDLAPTAIIVVDEQGRIALFNRESERLLGYSREELFGEPVDCLVPERYRAAHPAMRKDFLSAPESRPMGKGRDLFALRKDGTEVPVEIGLNPTPTEDGLMVVVSVLDLTERKRAEARFQAVVESSPMGMLMVDEHGTIVLTNREVARTFGYDEGELVGEPIEKLMAERFASAHPGHRKAYLEMPQARPMGSGRELFGLRSDGTEIPVEVGLTPIATDDGTFVLASVVDITLRKLTEAQLRDAQRLETVGALASGVAHDFNNVLLAIAGYAELLLNDPDITNESREDVRQITRAAERGRQVVERMLEISRRRPGPPQVTKLQETIAEALELLRASLLKSVEIRTHLDEAAPAVLCDSMQVHQIVMNLGSNAARAMNRSDGILEVSLVPCQPDAELRRRLPELRPGLYCRLTIADNGEGIPAEVAEHSTSRSIQRRRRPAARASGSGWCVRRYRH